MTFVVSVVFTEVCRIRVIVSLSMQPMAKIPEHERPRERLYARGAEALTDRELLALVIGKGTRGKSALDVATELLVAHGGLDGMASAHPEELSGCDGVGPAKATALVAALHLGRRAEHALSDRELIRSFKDVARVALRSIGKARREKVVVLVCNRRNHLLRSVMISEGSVDRALLPVREILNAVLRNDGRAFAVSHNHPSGCTEPSVADLKATEEIAAAAKTVGLRFLGHVIVAGNEWSPVQTRSANS